MARTCTHCGAPMSRLDDACPACGVRSTQRMPWYVYALGAFLVLLIFLWLADFRGLAEFIERALIR
jgi:hypothetical protein